MSFLQYKTHISEGDTVLICRGREKIIPIIVKKGDTVQIKGGAIPHDSLLGKEFGSKVYTTNNKGWVTVLHPTPELWTTCLPHRTQIIYSTDISFITMQLELRPGSVVCESGTGSGSLSHAIARTIAPTGHLFTFEFHEQRYKIAEEEFKVHRLSDIVTVACRDVCENGFDLENKVDAVFLDLPNPWEAIKSAKEAIKITGGRFCSFSPCIEQVQRTCEELQKNGFKDIDVVECLLRPFDVRPCIINVPSLNDHAKSGDQGRSSEDYELEKSIKKSEDQECSVEVSSSDQERSSEDKHSISKHNKRKLTTPIESTMTMYTCAPHRSIPGHTGFLTFASLLHKDKLTKFNPPLESTSII